MDRIVALLRGVNVGGHNKLAMAELRSIAEECGLEEVSTYVQSGNLVASTRGMSPSAVAEKLRSGIATRTEVEPDVIVRTRDELAEAVAANPFAQRGHDPTLLHVVFMPDGAAPAIESIDLPAFAPDAAVSVGRHLYLFLPTGMGRSRLASAVAKTSGQAGTTRNWRTVLKLLELVDQPPNSN